MTLVGLLYRLLTKKTSWQTIVIGTKNLIFKHVLGDLSCLCLTQLYPHLVYINGLHNTGSRHTRSTSVNDLRVGQTPWDVGFFPFFSALFPFSFERKRVGLAEWGQEARKSLQNPWSQMILNLFNPQTQNWMPMLLKVHPILQHYEPI